MNSSDVSLLQNMAQNLGIYIPWDLDYEKFPILLLNALIERTKLLELELFEIKKKISAQI